MHCAKVFSFPSQLIEIYSCMNAVVTLCLDARKQAALLGSSFCIHNTTETPKACVPIIGYVGRDDAPVGL